MSSPSLRCTPDAVKTCQSGKATNGITQYMSVISLMRFMRQFHERTLGSCWIWSSPGELSPWFLLISRMRYTA